MAFTVKPVLVATSIQQVAWKDEVSKGTLQSNEISFGC